MNESPKQHNGQPRTLVLFPGALGDFLCFTPTAHALRRGGANAVTIAANEAHRPLVDPSLFEMVSIDRREIASLFQHQPGDDAVELLGRYSTVLSWTGAADANFPHNLARLATGSARTFSFRNFASDEHAVDYYARCAGVEPAPAPLFLTTEAREWARTATARFAPTAETLAIHPGSGSPTKNWEGMAELARSWRKHRGPVIAIVGPAETESPDLVSWDTDCDAVVRDQRIDRVAALLQHIGFFAGNDSGIAHLAGAAGCSGVVLFGDTDPKLWRPTGPLKVVQAALPCKRCGRGRLCVHRLSVEQVHASLASSPRLAP